MGIRMKQQWRCAMSKQCLDVHQMQHLQELGLELDYDTLCRYVKFEDTDWLLKPSSDLNIIGISCRYIPAYTLQDVLDALPASIGYRRELYVLKLDMFNKIVCYRDTASDDTLVFVKFMEIPLIDAAYSMLCWAIKNKFVETNKNE